ncbi:MAG: SDR family oxidoreductase [Bacteroidetes bacterium]|nr:SDR family oxidoreductase [Bacteroidota bacterium]MCH8524551.1 SDR family oxidoreductase [Balneolales bacterium]
MNLEIDHQRFLVTGASSGLGNAVARQLLKEGAHVVVVARRADMLQDVFSAWSDSTTIIEGNILHRETIDAIEKDARKNGLHGAFINAGGPPTGTPLETTMDDWDAAWQLVMRWKIDLSLRLAPLMVEQRYGRIVFLESRSVKQPLPVLALSNAFRAGVVGFAKSLALEVASKGVTVNVIAPGSHDTPAIERVIEKSKGKTGNSYDEARKAMEANIPVGRMGKAEELATLAAWLFSPHASFVTGQTISHDGGDVAGLFG